MKIMIIIALLFSSIAKADFEYSVEYASNFTTMEWKGVSHAKYDFKLKTLGFVVYHDSGFGVRTSYGRGAATLPRNGAALPSLIIELKSAVDLEVLYRHKLYGNTYAYWGVGYYWDHLPITQKGTDYYKDDWDNDLGWTVGLEHKMTDYLSVQAKYQRRSLVGASWKHNGGLGSKHDSFGVSIRYTF